MECCLSETVIPAQAGIHAFAQMDTRFRGYDELEVWYDGLAVGYDELEVWYDGLAVGYDELEVWYDGLAVGYDGLEVWYDGLGAR